MSSTSSLPKAMLVLSNDQTPNPKPSPQAENLVPNHSNTQNRELYINSNNNVRIR
jgi:hypothetical protein